MNPHLAGDEQSRSAIAQLIRSSRPRALLSLFALFAREVARTPVHAWRRGQLRSNSHRGVGYVGFLGHQNLGDEAVFEAIRAQLAAPGGLIQFIAAEGESILSSLGLGGAALFRAVLLGGGTLIHPYYQPTARKVRQFGIPLYTVGTGVGCPGFGAPEQVSLEGWRELLDECPFLSVRGPLSCESLRNLGLNQAEVIGDPALSLAPEALPSPRSRPRLIINLAEEMPPVRDSIRHKMYQQLAKIAHHFAEKGGELIGVALGAGDRSALQAFVREHSVRGLKIENHRSSPETFQSTVAGSSALLGVRLHSAVLAASVGVCPILFCYRSKCRDFMMSMDLEDFAIEMGSPEAPRRIADCFEHLEADPRFGSTVHSRAMLWKKKQGEFCARLATALELC